MAKEVKAKGSLSEYETFSAALKKVLQVSHSEIKQRMKDERRTRRRKPKTSSASRDSGA